ncbi:hypothetical protein [Kitasatospora sp. NPDC050543]|uniref:hypothetical protein n=1 Tax=Kitasatospora sp. NPDC050543 TaxID=3364054 RepID=UPI003789D6D6
MSLSTRVIAAIGAVVVIGGVTVGVSVAHASDKDKPTDQRATLTVGRSSQEVAPLCSNGGQPLDDQAQEACQAKAQEALKAGTLPSSDVVASDRIGVGVTPDVADKGWFAFTSGGPQGRFNLKSAGKDSTYSGSVPAGQALQADGKTLVTVVESDPKSQTIYGVWYFQLNNKDA